MAVGRSRLLDFIQRLAARGEPKTLSGLRLRTAYCHLPTAYFFECEAPEHTLLRFVEAVLGGGDTPAARELPAPRPELVEEGDGLSTGGGG